MHYGLVHLDSGDAVPGARRPGAHVCLHYWLRQGLEGTRMLLLTAIVSLLLFVYLMAALLRPEWF
jgi:K+-transporting ATPase KdpF subunit